MTDVNNVRSAKSDCIELNSGFSYRFFLLNIKICEYYFRYIYHFIIFNCLYFRKLIINIVCVDFLLDLLNIASIDKRHVLNHRNIFTAKCSPALYIINYANNEYCDFCKAGADISGREYSQSGADSSTSAGIGIGRTIGADGNCYFYSVVRFP